MKWRVLKLAVGGFYMCLLLGTGGCSILPKESYKPVGFYDIGHGTVLPEGGYNIEISQFTTSGPYRTKMIYRLKSCELYIDEYNRWIQPPYIMLTRFMLEKFSGNISDKKSATTYQLSGDIVDFDIDLDKKKVVLTVEYELVDAESNDLLAKRCVTYTESFQEDDPLHFALAMSTAADKLVTDIGKVIAGVRSARKPAPGKKKHEPEGPRKQAKSGAAE